MTRAMYRWTLAILVTAIAVSLAGSALLWYAPTLAARAGALLPLFMKAPTWAYMLAFPVAVFVASLPGVGWRRAFTAVVVGSVVGLGMELLGTSTGWPFGPYSYGAFLGPKVLGLVPWVIPPSWYAVGVVAHALARRVAAGGLPRVVIGAAFMVCWDLVLDPAMIAAIPVWDWHVDGAFYGMPWLNLLGWFVTGIVIVSAYELLLRGGRRDILPAAPTLWLVSAALPFGLSLLRGMWGAAVVGCVVIAAPLALGTIRRVREVPAAAV